MIVYVYMAVRLWIGCTYLMQLSMVYDAVISFMVMNSYVWSLTVTYGYRWLPMVYLWLPIGYL